MANKATRDIVDAMQRNNEPLAHLVMHARRK
jgi:hypothetical protein